jgi:hypothetical protein
MATHPQKLEIDGVKKLLNRAVSFAALRQTLQAGEHRLEFKLSHGFRKYYKSNTERVMRPLNVELLMDHETGVSDSYWRPTEQDLLEDYLRAIGYLTVNKGVEKEREVEEVRQQSAKMIEDIKGLILMVRSYEPETILQSGVTATKLTAPSCPFNVNSSFLVLMSHILMVPSSQPETNVVLSEVAAIE